LIETPLINLIIGRIFTTSTPTIDRLQKTRKNCKNQLKKIAKMHKNWLHDSRFLQFCIFTAVDNVCKKRKKRKKIAVFTIVVRAGNNFGVFLQFFR
jgi:hypothetical protein